MTEFSQSTIGPSADKRYFPRWQVKNRIVYRLDGDMNLHEARTRDLSCTGVSLVSRYPVAMAQKLKIRIYLFEEDNVELEGHPMWAKETDEGHLVGINFVNITTDIQNKILQYAFEIKKTDVVNHWFEGWKKP